MASENDNSSSSAAATTINETTPEFANSPILEKSEVADALMSLSCDEDLANEGEGEESNTTTSVVVDALMSLKSVNDNKGDGEGSTTTGEAANYYPSVVPLAVHGGGEGGSGSGTTTVVADEAAAAAVKKCIGRSNRRTSWTTVVDRGMRNHMEDKIMTVRNFMSMPCDQFGGCTAPNCRQAAQSSRIHYLAVFDGHSGGQVSAYCASTLHEIITQEWSSESGVDEWGQKWQIALSRAYERINEICKDGVLASAGSTAVVVLLSACQIIAANCGDSRAVLVRKTETVPLTNDHKPDRADEVERINKDGGFIMNVHGVLRVGGVLAMTRAIGDQSLKPWVSSVPEITFTTRSKEDECLVIASDGVWDVLTSNEVGEFARSLIREKRRAALSGQPSSFSVANLILEKARSRDSTDNISVIVVDMKPLRKFRPVVQI